MSQRTSYTLTLATAALLALGCKTVVLPGDEGGGGSETDSTSGTGGGTAGGSSTGEVSANCSELASQTQTALETNCEKCHGADSQALGSINYITNLDALIANGKVVPGDPNNSAIYRRITSMDTPMPPASETQRPTPDDITAIEAWISECAGVTGCGAQPWMGREEVINTLRNDLLNTLEISADARPFIRYFSLVHLYNYGWCDDQIEVYRQAFYKLINSLSQDTKIVPPVAVDPDRLLFRVDLRDYNWDLPAKRLDPENGAVIGNYKDVWDLIVDQDPYAIEFIGDSAADLKKETQTPVFLLQADAFLESATQPPLYHDILGIPFTRQELEAQFGIDVEFNILDEISTDPDRVARAAFHDSGVSENHRVIERHDFPDNSNRVYWISYDFNSNAGDANVFVRPFGNADVADALDPNGTQGFDGFSEAGSEIIFSLPNGMQGYMVVKVDGTRLDEAPINIVQDKNADDGIVRNGISCMGCHSAGMISKEDDLRWEIDQGFGEADFNQDELDAIRALYPSRDEMNQLLKLDSDRFNLAVENSGVQTGGSKEPIVTVFNAFDEDVEIRRAAAELWTTESTLREKLAELSPDLDDLGKAETGVRRDVFTAAYADAICKLKVGVTKACPGGI